MLDIACCATAKRDIEALARHDFSVGSGPSGSWEASGWCLQGVELMIVSSKQRLPPRCGFLDGADQRQIERNWLRWNRMQMKEE